MTNIEIITNAALAEGLYTEAQIEQFMLKFGRLPLFTFAEWKKAGYKIKKGEKAKLSCHIFKYKTRKKKGKDNEETEEKIFYLVKAHFFDESQVERFVKDE